MITLEIKNYNITLTEKQPKYQDSEYLTDEEILPPDQSRIREQANSTYSSLGKAFEKYIKKNY